MNAKINENLPRINYYANSSRVIREIRDDKETTAWSLQRGINYNTQEINQLTEQISILESTDFTEFET